MQPDPMLELHHALAPYRAKVVAHPLYGLIRSRAELARFMELHAFAVWDFMSLLKRLQRDLTVVELPWIPPRHPVAARLINEIVLGEETDRIPGRDAPISHYELYLEAMDEVGASSRVLRAFVSSLANTSWPDAVRLVPHEARPFVEHTLSTAMHGKTHEVAAAFLFGREDPIPAMFRRIVDTLERSKGDCAALRVYLERHIEVDEGEHAPLASQMLRALCGDDAQRWNEARLAGEAALEARAALWDAIAVQRSSPEAGTYT